MDFIIKRNRLSYSIFYEEKEIYSVERKENFFTRNRIKFFDKNKICQIKIVEKHFLFILISRKVYFFLADSQFEILSKMKKRYFNFKGNEYAYYFTLFGRDKHFYKDNQIAGAYKILEGESYGIANFQISAENYDDCLMFSILHIAMDKWGI